MNVTLELGFLSSIRFSKLGISSHPPTPTPQHRKKKRALLKIIFLKPNLPAALPTLLTQNHCPQPPPLRSAYPDQNQLAHTQFHSIQTHISGSKPVDTAAMSK